MYNKRKRWFPFFILIIFGGFLLLALLVKLLWNYVMPALFSVAAITYLQAVALLLLCRILFGGFRRGTPGFRRNDDKRCGPGWRRKWMQMSDEEKAKFKEEWRRRMKPPQTPPSEGL